LKLTPLALCVLFSAPFLLLGATYHGMPPEMAVLRIPFVHWMPVQPKSLFLIFRVPLMNLIHGVMAAVMLTHASDFGKGDRRIAFRNLFLTLVFAIAFKSDFEALDLSTHGTYERWLTLGALASVLGGLGLAALRGRNVPLPWPELRLGLRDAALLIVLFAAYLAIVSLVVARLTPSLTLRRGFQRSASREGEQH
jgi:hypothetical protein